MHAFGNSTVKNDGIHPEAGVIQASDGNYYGTTATGGAASHGTAFKMTPSGQIAILHSFGDGGVVGDGLEPSSIVQGADGNFYGTTGSGGSTTGQGSQGQGFGTVFKMTPSGQITILHSFNDGTVANDGIGPVGGLVLGRDGNFYGTTYFGGASFGEGANGYGYGTLFKISPTGVVTILHSFTGAINDAGYSNGNLVQSANGNFFGTTQAGGTSQVGYVYKMTPAGDVTVLYSFGQIAGDRDGAFPEAGLIQDADGNLYGTTSQGGPLEEGSVFRITQSGSLTTLCSFGTVDQQLDGDSPQCPLLLGSDGNLYGTTMYGGYDALSTGYSGNGTVFQVTPSGTLTFIHEFLDGTVANDGAWPAGALCEGSDGNIYGTTYAGGPIGSLPNASFANGTLFRLSLGLTPPIPKAPISLRASAANASVDLSWLPSAGATSYNVYRGTSPGGEATTPVATGVTGDSFVNTGLTDGVSYYYQVAAVNAEGISARSPEAVAKPTLTVPASPTGLKATAGIARVALSWTASSGATSYNVYRGTSAGGEGTVAIATGITAATFTDIKVMGNVTYYYKVSAENSAGTSALSNEASARPAPPAPIAPTDLVAKSGNALVTLTWTASAEATSYNVYRGTTAGGESSTPIAVGVTATTFVSTGLVNGTTYYYKVVAVDVTGTSPLSNEASATPEPPVPAAPTSLKATAGDAQVTLTWIASSGATSYTVYRTTAATAGSWTRIATGITATTYSNVGLTDGTTYFYYVTAVNAGGESARSNEVSAVPKAH